MKKKIVVFGSYMNDVTGWGEKLPQPGETVTGGMFKTGPGGKGSNQAVAANRAGADVIMIAKLGDDVFGQSAKKFYESEGMITDFLMTQPGGQTGTAIIMVDEVSAQNMIMILPGANSTFTDKDIEKNLDCIKQAEYLLVQNEINRDALEKVIAIGAELGVKVVFNPAPARVIAEDLYKNLYLITPNETETQTLTGIPVDSKETAQKAADWFFAKGVKNVIITMGSAGAFVSDGNRSELLPPPKVKAVDTTGAGDSFNGVLLTALAEGKDLFEAAKFANVGAALSVTKPGAAPSMAHRSDIENFIKEL